MTTAMPNRVLAIGATGGIGPLAVAAASRHGLQVRAFARDLGRARKILPGVDVRSDSGASITEAPPTPCER
jgi:uncharacterized protein YbjT (DUF2867 family)